jgi:hypothetical protein
MRVVPAFLAMSLALAAPAAAEPVTIEEVRGLAFDKGELDDGIWEVEGYDASGHEIEMRVEAASGQIIKLEPTRAPCSTAQHSSRFDSRLGVVEASIFFLPP